MVTKHTYVLPDCEYDLFREDSVLCNSGGVGAELEDLSGDPDTIEWVG